MYVTLVVCETNLYKGKTRICCLPLNLSGISDLLASHLRITNYSNYSRSGPSSVSSSFSLSSVFFRFSHSLIILSRSIDAPWLKATRIVGKKSDLTLFRFSVLDPTLLEEGCLTRSCTYPRKKSGSNFAVLFTSSLLARTTLQVPPYIRICRCDCNVLALVCTSRYLHLPRTSHKARILLQADSNSTHGWAPTAREGEGRKNGNKDTIEKESQWKLREYKKV